MSIRFPDLQVLLPRATEGARTQQVMQRQPILGQEQQAAHDQAVRRRKAQTVQEKGSSERVRYEEESGGSGRQRNDGRGESPDGQDEAALDGDTRDTSERYVAQHGPGERVDLRV